MRTQEGTGTADQEKIMQSLDQFKQRTGFEVPAIERTLMKLTKEPKDRSLWARLAQRVLGYLVGLVEVWPPRRARRWFTRKTRGISTSTVGCT